MNVVLKRATANRKLTGGKRRNDVWVLNPADTYDTCPTTCAHLPRALFDIAVSNGLPVATEPTHACYANGRVAHFAVRGGDTLSLSDAVDVIVSEAPNGTLIRWAEVGDIVTSNPADVIATLARIRTARPDITFIGYTHAWRMLGGIGADMFRASCETPLDVMLAESMGYRAAMTVPEDWTQTDARNFATEHNTGRVFVCPAAIDNDRQSCITCKACDTSTHNVAFPAHGTRKSHAGKGIA